MSKTLDNLSIGLDVDGLLACFPCGVLKRAQSLGLQNKFPNSCKLVSTWDMSESFQEVMKDVWKDDSFWLNLPRLYTKNLPFKPAAYITNRHISSDTTKQWLISMGFPNAEVVTVKTYKDKLQEIQKRKINVFVDDYFLRLPNELPASNNIQTRYILGILLVILLFYIRGKAVTVSALDFHYIIIVVIALEPWG